jgi:hypothetical protein
MKTSKSDKKDQLFDYLGKKWQHVLVKLDERPSRTGIFMAVILFIVLCLYTVSFINRWNNPSGYDPENKNPIELIRQGFGDSISISDKFSEYLLLLEIQKELEEMLQDTTRIDSTRVEELLKILK